MKNQSGNGKCMKSLLQTKIAMLLLGLAMCLSLALGITLASPTATASAEEGTTVTQLTVSGLTEADLPEIGPLSDLSGITLNDGLTINTAFWFALNMRQKTDTFESGHTYALRLQYSAPEGKTVSLTDPSKVTLAGIDPSKYTVELDDGRSFINFVFDALGDEELSLVNPERMNVPDGFVGEYITTDAIYVKGGKYPYKFSDMYHPEWLKYTVLFVGEHYFQIYFSGYRPTVSAPAESFGFKVTDAEGNTQTFTGTTGATVENPDGIANIVLQYDLPAVGEEKPTTAELKSAITLPEGVAFQDGDSVWFWKEDDLSGGTLTQFERWGTYELSAKLKTTDGKTFAGLAMLKGTILSTSQYSVTADFGNKTDTTLTVQFTIKMYGVSLEEQENYKITAEALKKGKVGVPYSDKIEFGKPADVTDADIEIKSNSRYVKYGGLSLSADGTFAGTPDRFVYYDWGDTVYITFEYYCKGYLLDSKTLTLTVEGYTQIPYVESTTLYYNGTEQTAYEDAEGYTVTGNKATDVGTYKATFKLNPGYVWGGGSTYDSSDLTVTWWIEKGNREAPTGLSAVSTSGKGKSDGKITGVTEEMEYKKTTSSAWTAVTGTEITGLSAGTYAVIYAETDNWNASSSTLVTVTDGGIVSYTLDVVGGRGSGVFEAGKSVTITANAPATGKEFGRWEITGLDTSGLDLTKAELTFTMPENNVIATARYSYIDYKVTVVGGTAQVDADAEPTSEVWATYECQVSIFADTAPTGKRFVRWTSEDGVVFANATSAETKFTMPANNVTVTAVFEDIDYTVTVTDGTADKATAHYGDSVKITADEPEKGKEFDKWTVTGLDTAGLDLTKPELTFTMPAGDVKATANYKDIQKFYVSVTGGTGGGEYYVGATVTVAANPLGGAAFVKWTVTGIDTAGLDLTKPELTFIMPLNNVTVKATYSEMEYSVTVIGGTADKAKAKYGDIVTVTANAPAGKRFARWTSEGGVSFDNLTSEETTFKMPANSVTITAVFEDIDYTVTVTDGTADKTIAHCGDTVSITADEAPEGKVFDKWTCETAGVTIEFASATSAETTFTMPAGDITVKANYRNVEEAPSFEIKVNGGTGAGTYKEGESVTVTANDPEEGKIFKGWKDESGNIVSTEKVYTFTVSGEVSLTAVYEDKPTGGDGTGDGTGGDKTPEPDKGGLSTGAIVGIAVGSVAVAGLGGFAIFWFVIRKKSFADLIAVFRKKK